MCGAHSVVAARLEQCDLAFFGGADCGAAKRAVGWMDVCATQLDGPAVEQQANARVKDKGTDPKRDVERVDRRPKGKRLTGCAGLRHPRANRGLLPTHMRRHLHHCRVQCRGLRGPQRRVWQLES